MRSPPGALALGAKTPQAAPRLVRVVYIGTDDEPKGRIACYMQVRA
jgi:hypothetical protein